MKTLIAPPTIIHGLPAALLLIFAGLGCNWIAKPQPPKGCMTASTYVGSHPPEPGSPAAQILGCWAKDGEREFVFKFENGYMDQVTSDGDSFRGKTEYAFVDRTTIQFGDPRSSSSHVSLCSVETEENHFTMQCKQGSDGKTTIQSFRRVYSTSSSEPINNNSMESK